LTAVKILTYGSSLHAEGKINVTHTFLNFVYITPKRLLEPISGAHFFGELIVENMKGGRGERYICFSLGREKYAIPLLMVKEVIAPPEITPIPHAPPYFLGIMNLRGQVISVVDLRSKLEVKAAASSETAIVICDLKPASVGVMVDSIDSVVNVGANDVAERPEIKASKASEFITGVFRREQSLVLMLDIAKTLNLDDQQAIARVSSSKAS
jgi:purine-binding chemotaxis protein CheW